MKVICISGKAGHGKDTTALLIKEQLELSGNRVLIAHYGDLVKYVCHTFFDWNGEKDVVGRTLLQYVGTDQIRAQNPNFWVDFILDILRFFPNEWDYVLIPDSRFPNEIDAVKNAGFDCIHIRVTRPNFAGTLTEKQKQHPSETALDDYISDTCIMNDGTLEHLRTVISEWLVNSSFTKLISKEEKEQ